jgi:hypothetical protein
VFGERRAETRSANRRKVGRTLEQAAVPRNPWARGWIRIWPALAENLLRRRHGGYEHSLQFVIVGYLSRGSAGCIGYRTEQKVRRGVCEARLGNTQFCVPAQLHTMQVNNTSNAEPKHDHGTTAESNSDNGAPCTQNLAPNAGGHTRTPEEMARPIWLSNLTQHGSKPPFMLKARSSDRFIIGTISLAVFTVRTPYPVPNTPNVSLKS